MERQASGAWSGHADDDETEKIGMSLMRLEATVRDLASSSTCGRRTSIWIWGRWANWSDRYLTSKRSSLG